MRCLYCGKELALLKRLTGGGEFCSDAHQKQYQEEYDRIALGRLLQAQKKAQKSGSEPAAPKAASGPAAPPPAAPVSAEPAWERVVQAPAEELLADSVEEPVEEIVEESLAPQESEPETEVPEVAGFLVQQPVPPEMCEDPPDLKPAAIWVEAHPTPSVPAMRIERGLPALSSAGPVTLNVMSQNSSTESPSSDLNASIQAFPPAESRPRLPSRIATTNSQSRLLSSGRPFSIEVPLRALKVALDGPQTLNFQIDVAFGESALMALPAPHLAEFPAEGADVRVSPDWNPSAASQELASAPESGTAARLEFRHDPGRARPAQVQAPLESPASSSSTAIVATLDEPEEPVSEDTSKGAVAATPHATLEALSRLHEVMQLETASPPRTSPQPTREPEQAEAAASTEVPGHQVSAPGSEESGAPRGSNDLLDIPIKILTLPKRMPASVNVLATPMPALVPRLKGLPLRPKTALAPSNSVPPPSRAANSAAPVKEPASSPAPAAKVSAPGNVSTQASSSSQPEPVASKPKAQAFKPANAPKSAPPSQSGEKRAQTPKPAEMAAKSVEPTSEPAEAASKSAEPSPTGANAAKTARRTSSKETGQREQPAAPEPGASKPSPPEGTPKAKPQPPQPALVSEGGLPTFGSLGRPQSFWGSFKVKLGFAVLLVAGGCAAYFGWGGKSQPTNVPAAKSAADNAGPSIILGEGGWVVDWGGDGTGAHAGREITIYRPSLKLSDYRIEFQGDIDSKSLGWVFRASDPDNYYAMKLTEVSTGLPGKVALFKYIVVKGHQTQVGRVPVDLDVRNDTVFKVRVDVRGPKFSTYVQSQPVDVWTDDQLKSGGVGFLNERGERGRIKSVSIRYLAGADQ